MKLEVTGANLLVRYFSQFERDRDWQSEILTVSSLQTILLALLQQ